VYLKNKCCTRLALLLHALTTTATHILPSVPSSSVERCAPFRSHYPSSGLPLGSSSVSEAFSQLWRPHICTCRLSRRPRGLAPSRTVRNPTDHEPWQASDPAHRHPISHSPSRKVSKTLSFFPLRDSYGTTQLVVHTPTDDPRPDEHSQQSNPMTELGRIPVESTVLIHGHVRLRPEKQRRPVNCAP
jgi:hypothetical protein